MNNLHRPEIKVLMYHRVAKDNPVQSNDENVVSEKTFETQMRLLDALNFTPITFEDYQLYIEDKLTLPKKPVIITFDDGYRNTYEVAKPILQNFDMRAVIYVLGDRSIKYARWDCGPVYEDSYALMSNEQMLQLRADGFEIGAHSMTHSVLPNLSTNELEWEVATSKESIEKVLGEKIISFAYPFGLLNNYVYKKVLNSGYKFACGVYTGPPRFGDDKYNIRRITINDKMGTLRFSLRLLLPYEYFEWFYYQLKKKSKTERELALNQYLKKDSWKIIKDNTEIK